ncbi:hypothetical protein CLIB1423_18S01970 [[Candida] railenensis]|uniref:Uncharacterized protein n=1 Tax=[Candida] railenensis TaxID=45579 RepID=A0A9P0QUD9_9ASCO|nr:hypothetical protein CLIB1423_18S01970 [[Candida] railenensis]
MENPPLPENYTAIVGLSRFLAAMNNMPADGTGITILVKQSHNLMGTWVPPVLENYVKGLQINLFGDYPNKSDLVPSIIFAVVFFILLCAHLFVYFMNYSRGHYFYISLCAAFYCIVRILGFSLRAVWSQDISQGLIGLTGEVFLILGSIIIVSFNLILAQRIFTWRHPVGGSRKLFWGTMFQLYGFVLGVIAMTIVAGAVPSLYLLGKDAYRNYNICTQASSILIILYSLTSLILLALTFFFKPTKKDKNLYTYQPWWIESFGTFYYVQSGEPQRAASSFLKRNSNHRHAIRVIASTNHHANMVEGLSNSRGDVTHNLSMGLILTSTLLIFIGALLRAIVIFQGNIQRNTSSVGKPVVMYICWGVFEVIINILYLVGRIDLRFYRPDRLPKEVRAIVTAQQSAVHSDNEDEEEYADSDEESSDSDDNGKLVALYSRGIEKRISVDDQDNEFRF